jgi:Na+-driven multidrug efflux pump
MVYVLFGYWAVGAPTGVYLFEARGLGVTGILIGLAAGVLVTTVLTLARLLTTRRTAN